MYPDGKTIGYKETLFKSYRKKAYRPYICFYIPNNRST
jgi:hypothetical protein